MVDPRRNKLIVLGPERLADALLGLAQVDGTVNDAVDRLVATPAQSVARYKAKLAALKKMRGTIDDSGSWVFARQLRALLDDLRAGHVAPKTGLELMAKFFETDAAVFESCDDSSGTVGDVFQGPACDLFAEFASACEDKALVADRLTCLSADENYGVRNCLVDAAHRFLSPEQLRALAEEFRRRAAGEGDKSDKSDHWMHGAESLGRQAENMIRSTTA